MSQETEQKTRSLPRFLEWRRNRDLRDFDYSNNILPLIQRVESLWENTKGHEDQFELQLSSICAEIRQKIEALRNDTDHPDVSIVVPAHNEQKNILSLFLSIANQSFSGSIEVIIVDNNSDSKDRTAEIAEQCGAKVISYNLDYDSPNRKLSQISLARQKGLEAAQGEIIISTDSDVAFGPNWVQTLVTPLQDQSITCTSGIVNNYHRQSLPVLYYFDKGVNTSRWLMQRRVNRHQSKRFAPTAGSCTAFRKTDAIQVGGYKLNQYPAEDSALGLALSQIGTIKFLRDPEARVWVSPRRLVEKYQEVRSQKLSKMLRKNIHLLLNGNWIQSLIKSTYSDNQGREKNIR